MSLCSAQGFQRHLFLELSAVTPSLVDVFVLHVCVG